MSTQYPAVVAALVSAWKGVADLRAVLPYQPTSIQYSPAMYVLLEGFDRERAAQLTVMRYRITGRVCVKWQDNEKAEEQLAALINPVCAAIDADPHLGGVVNQGVALVTAGTADWLEIGGVICRYCDITITATTKGASDSGI